MWPVNLRMEALHLAVKTGVESGDLDADTIVEDAEKFYEFLAKDSKHETPS